MSTMGAPSREELVHKYFVPIPAKPSYTGPLTALIGGAALLLIALLSLVGASIGGGSNSAAGAGCMSCLAAVGGIPAVGWGGLQALQRVSAYSALREQAFPRASGAQMDQWLAEGLQHASAVAPGRLNRYANEQTLRWGVDTLLFVGSPSLRDFPVQFAYGDDGKLRASLHKVLIVFLSNYRLSTYECVLDMRTGATVSDATKEYHLQHVDGLETASDRISIALANQGGTEPTPLLVDQSGQVAHITTQQTMSLVVAGRRAVELVMAIASSERLQMEGIANPSSPEAMIHTLREHLRRHNGGVAAPIPHALPPLPPQL